jgi:hypothetical protein
VSDQQLIIIVLGIVALFGLAVLAYFGKKTAEIAALIKPVFELLISRADTVLAEYGTELKPLHEMFDAAESAIDDPNDPLYKLLNSPTLIAAFREAFEKAQALTDGEAKPLGG